MALCSWAAAEPFINLPASLANTKAKLAAGGQADILLLGDSLTMFPTSYTNYFRDLMQGQYGNAGAGYQPFSIWDGGGLDGDWIWQTVNTDLSPHHSMDGLWVSTTQNGADGFLTARNQTIQFQYLAQPGGGVFRPFNWSYPGFWLGDPVDTNSPVPEVRTWQYTVPPEVPDNKIWYVTQSGGTVTLLGQNNFTADPGVRIHRAANGGWQVTNFLQRDFTFDEQTKLLHPDLVMIMLGANDSGGTSAEQFKINMNLLIDRVQADLPSADIVLMSPYDLSPLPDPDDHMYQRVVVPDEEIANERGVGFINLHEIAGDYDGVWVANNFLYDGVHPTAAGGEYLADILFSVFQTGGVSPRWFGSVVDPYRPDLPPAGAAIPEPASLAGILLLWGSMWCVGRASPRRCRQAIS